MFGERTQRDQRNIERDKMPPKINEKKCTSCGNCVRVCPTNALKISKEYPVLNAGVCINCGLCSLECPVGAITRSRKKRKKVR